MQNVYQTLALGAAPALFLAGCSEDTGSGGSNDPLICTEYTEETPCEENDCVWEDAIDEEQCVVTPGARDLLANAPREAGRDGNATEVCAELGSYPVQNCQSMCSFWSPRYYLKEDSSAAPTTNLIGIARQSWPVGEDSDKLTVMWDEIFEAQSDTDGVLATQGMLVNFCLPWESDSFETDIDPQACTCEGIVTDIEDYEKDAEGNYEVDEDGNRIGERKFTLKTLEADKEGNPMDEFRCTGSGYKQNVINSILGGPQPSFPKIWDDVKEELYPFRTNFHSEWTIDNQTLDNYKYGGPEAVPQQHVITEGMFNANYFSYSAPAKQCMKDPNCGIDFETNTCVEIDQYCGQFNQKYKCDAKEYPQQKIVYDDDNLEAKLAEGKKCAWQDIDAFHGECAVDPKTNYQPCGGVQIPTGEKNYQFSLCGSQIATAATPAEVYTMKEGSHRMCMSTDATQPPVNYREVSRLTPLRLQGLIEEVFEGSFDNFRPGDEAQMQEVFESFFPERINYFNFNTYLECYGGEDFTCQMLCEDADGEDIECYVEDDGGELVLNEDATPTGCSGPEEICSFKQVGDALCTDPTASTPAPTEGEADEIEAEEHGEDGDVKELDPESALAALR